MSNQKRIKKAIKQLGKINNPNVTILDIIEALSNEISSVPTDNETLLNIIEDLNFSYDQRRDALTDLLENGAELSFNYEKRDGTNRVVNVEWNDEYTYDVPPKGSEFIYMYDVDDDFFKHFKLDKISEVVIG